VAGSALGCVWAGVHCEVCGVLKLKDDDMLEKF